MGKIFVKLGDPNSSFEDNGVTLSGSNEVEVDLTDKISRAIQGGILQKINPEERIVVQPGGKSTNSNVASSSISFEEEKVAGDKLRKRS